MCYIPQFFFFKQKTAYEMRISDWSSDVCSSDLNLENSKGHRRAMSGTIDADTPFNSPIIDACQKNYIIYIGSGLPSDNAQDTATVIDELKIGRASCRERVCQYV